MANVHIEKSSLMARSEFLEAYRTAPRDADYLIVSICRSERSILREWAAHHLLYDLHILRSHTESVDLNYPQRWYVRLAYFIVGGVALLFYR